MKQNKGENKMILYNFDNGPQDTRGFLDVIERNGQLLAKWRLDKIGPHCIVENLKFAPRHFFEGAPLEATFTFYGWRYWLCDQVITGTDLEAYRRRLVDLMIEAKRTDPETGPFSEYLAQYLMDHGVRILDCGR
jgi:hypothetical protein